MIENIAPHITRQRLLIEGFFNNQIDTQSISDYLHGVAEHLGLRTYGEPTIFSPAGMGKKENQGYDAFIPLIDSGISLYVWSNERFLSLIIYTCKHFDEAKAVKFTREFFQLKENLIWKLF